MARSKALLNVLNLVSDKEELPIERQFLNELQYSIEKESQKGSRKPSKSYKPSSMHCIRNMWFQMMGADTTQERADSSNVGICESGTDRHNRIQEAVMKMSENGVDCFYIDVAKFIEERGLNYLKVISKNGNETKLYHTELNISFLSDGIIKYKGKYYILEIKTETSNKFWDRKGVDPDHYLQGTAYSMAFGLSKVIFLYECRDNCSKKAFMLNVTDEMRDNLKSKIKECDGYVERKICPPKPEDVSKKACAYCAYAETCKVM